MVCRRTDDIQDVIVVSIDRRVMIGVLAIVVSGFPSIAQPTDDGMWLLDGCTGSAAKLVPIHPSDSVEVRYSITGNDQACYAVTVNLGERLLRGYLLGAVHPAVAEFEQAARSCIPALPVPEKPRPSRDNAAPAEDRTTDRFAGLKLVAVDGRKVDLAA